MRSARLALTLLVTALTWLSLETAPLYAQEARVELELAMGSGFPPQNAHEWLKTLEKVNADGIRIRNSQNGDGIGIKNVGTEDRPRYKVYGMLTADNKLMLEGGTYRISDIAGIKGYIGRLRDEGVNQMFAEKVGFGLTAEELVDVHGKLDTPIAFDTKGKEFDALLREFKRAIAMDIVVDRRARRGIAEGDPALDELKGVTAGTALAAICRPLGAVVVPQKQRDGKVQLAIMDSRDTKEHWPIGWPIEEAPIKVAPSLFKELPVQISDFKLNDALDAIQPRVEMPFLYDHNSLVRNGIELDQVDVQLDGEMSYFSVIRRLLGQARPKLISEIRTDEAGKPLLWITTLRQ